MTSKYLKIVNINEPCHEYDTIESAMKFPYTLDNFQKYGVCAIQKNENVLCCAKTGSGKSDFIYGTIAHALNQGKRVFCTTPIKSLSNQKFHDLKQMWPADGQVGIMTGDIKFCPNAQILVMTTEILRNLLYKKGTSTEQIGLTASLSLENLGAVVFDECHYINDKDRGAVWEETMILLPPSVQLIMLSATLSKPEMFAEWIGELKQVPCHVIQTQFRVVPLTHAVLENEELRTIMDNKEIFYDSVYNAWLQKRHSLGKDHERFQDKVKAERRAGFEGAVSGKVKPVSFKHQLKECITMLEKRDLLPALVFVFSRKGCEVLASKTEHTLLSTSDQAACENIFDFHLKKHKAELETLPQYHAIRTLCKRGIAFHHSGLLPLLKEIVEILFTKGYIKLLYCTETFAVGINMPTKTVVFTGLQKHDDTGMRWLRTDEYIQMAGRAGRRGKDKQGLVIYLPEHDTPSTAEMRTILMGGRPQIQSRMTFHYDFLLKTFQAKNTKWIDLLHKSYWFRQLQDSIQEDRRLYESTKQSLETSKPSSDIVEAFVEQENLEKNVKLLSNAKRRDAQRRLDRWKEEHDGPTWTRNTQSYKKWKDLQEVVKGYETNLEAASQYTNGVQACLDTLVDFGYLNQDQSLTKRGVIATEFNEGHTILCTEFFSGGHHSKLTGAELVAVLASFIDDSDKDEMPSIAELNVPSAVRDALYALGLIVSDCQKVERGRGVQGPDKYWNLSTRWIEPVWRWLHGENASIICQEYGLFEGNFVRSILRIANLVDESVAVATFTEDLETLEKLQDLNLVRDFLKPDSLYLHL